MSEVDAGNHLRILVKAVSDDLWIGIANYEVYAPTAFDAQQRRDGREEELQALRAIRNMRLAHTHDPNKPDRRLRSGVRIAVNDDELLLLEATILVVQQLHGLIGSPGSLDYRAEREA